MKKESNPPPPDSLKRPPAPPAPPSKRVSGHERVVSAQPTELERWDLFRAEMLEHQKQLGKLAKNFLELEAFDSAAECAIKADGIKYVIGRMPKAH